MGRLLVISVVLFSLSDSIDQGKQSQSESHMASVNGFLGSVKGHCRIEENFEEKKNTVCT